MRHPLELSFVDAPDGDGTSRCNVYLGPVRFYEYDVIVDDKNVRDFEREVCQEIVDIGKRLYEDRFMTIADSYRSYQ